MTVTLPDGFLWGVAGAAHQIEGGNWNNDWWAWEHAPNTSCVEVSGDCCDSYHRHVDDVALVAELGFASYRFSIEWSRIEPEDGEFSRAALDHYRRVLAACHEHGVAPVVTFHHFTTPRWMADRGGWAVPEVVDKFARFCEKSVAAAGRSDLDGLHHQRTERRVAPRLPDGACFRPGSPTSGSIAKRRSTCATRTSARTT